MVLQMYIDGTLIESVPLSVQQFADSSERDLYIQGAVNDMLERWDDFIERHNTEPQFIIRPPLISDRP